MPGFGSGPFGREPFGEWKWSRQVLYEYVPELYRASDPDGLFELFIEALRGQFDKQRHLIRDFANLRSALLVRTQFDDVERLRLGPVIVPQGELEQQGISARVDALYQFIAPTGRFRAEDEGKELRVSGSTVVGNNRAVTIIKVLSLTTVLTDPQLRTDSGSLRWEVREKVSVPTDHITVEVRGGDVSRVNPGWYVYDGRANFEILQRRQFAQKGVFAFQNEREGSDGAILAAPYFQAASGSFTEKDVGKWITIANSAYAANNAKFEIVGINKATSPPTLTLRGPETTPETGLFWAVLPHPELALSGTAIPLGVVQQEGVDGVLTVASTTFTSATALFTSGDVDKWILFVALSGYDRPIEAQIVSVTDANTVTLSLTAPASFTDVVWELRSTPLCGEVERSGIDLEITEIDFSDNRIATVLVPSGTFRPADVGFELRLTNSSITNNNDTYVIIDVVDLDVIKIQRGYPSPSGSAITVDDGPLTWELIEPQFTPLATDSGVLTRVQAHAQSHIQQWAPDFGIEIDTQESEARQRSWVGHVNVWLDKKGHEDGYKILGAISGFNVTVYQLWRIQASWLAFFDSSDIFEIGEDADGRSGADGQLVTYLGDLSFYSPTARFRASDVGTSIRIGNSSVSGNDSIYTISGTFTGDPTRVILEPVLATLPEYGIGGTSSASTLAWGIVRFFTSKPPVRPRFDDFNADAMTEWIANNAPATDELTLDKFCWEDDFGAFVEVNILSVTNIEGNIYEISMVPTTGVADLDIIPDNGATEPVRLDLPVWKITDSAGNTYVVENVPSVTLGGGTSWITRVLADPVLPPVVGVGTIDYQCLNLPDCGFCGASAVAVVIEEGSIADEVGVAVERVLERVLLRLNQHPKPVHVQIIPIFKRILEAPWAWTAIIDPNYEVYDTLLAPFTAPYDDFPADTFPPDIAITAEVESTQSVWAGGFDE